jgi:hypothetical protein
VFKHALSDVSPEDPFVTSVEQSGYAHKISLVSLMEESSRTFTNGAMTKRANKKKAMMARGHPMSMMNFFILSN